MFFGIRSNTHGLVFRPPQPKRLTKEPLPQCIAAAERLEKRTKANVNADYDPKTGTVRTLSTEAEQGFPMKARWTGDARKHAKALLADKDVRGALKLRGIELRNDELVQEPDGGFRVDFRQVVTVKKDKRAYQVRDGYVSVHVNANGAIQMVISTIRRAKAPRTAGKIITPLQATTAAQIAHGHPTSTRLALRLVLSAHKGKFNPLYELTLMSETPRKVMEYLVEAKTGAVVFVENKLHFAAVGGRGFLRIPDPNKPIDGQVFDIDIDSLPDPKVLANQRLTMYIGSDKSKPVKANAEGNFKFKPGTSEFTAVAVFFALNKQLELYEKLGMKKQTKPIPVFVDDHTVSDNAYFDPSNYEIHLGIGSGLPSGLNKEISWDLGVEWHENGHHLVFLQTPGHDLGGSEGGAANESTGDTAGDLPMDFWFRCVFGKQLGHELTRDDIKNDRLVIGVYALPPDGIRIQKNTKKYPDDVQGEVHADGLISGGACAEILVAMATNVTVSIQVGLESYLRLYIKALSLVPKSRVLFVDLLRAFITADQSLNQGANKALITRCFGNHGIKVKKVTSAKKPVASKK
jgi:hypothetical protein